MSTHLKKLLANQVPHLVVMAFNKSRLLPGIRFKEYWLVISAKDKSKVSRSFFPSEDSIRLYRLTMNARDTSFFKNMAGQYEIAYMNSTEGVVYQLKGAMNFKNYLEQR